MNDTKPLALTVLEEKDANGAPVFEVKGMKFFYSGETEKGDKVWQNRELERPEAIVFLGPDYEFTEHHIGWLLQ